jgi:translocation and assembly module TamB
VILRWLGGVLCGAVLAAVLALLWLLGTPPGTALLVRQAIALVPGSLEVSGLAGSVLDGISVAEVRYRVDETAVSLRGLQVQWRPAALAAGQLRIGPLVAEEVTVTIAAVDADEPGERFAMPDIRAPLPVTVERAALGALRIQAGDFRETIRDLVLAASLDASRLEIDELSGTFAGIALQIAGEAELIAQLPLRLQVAWQLVEPALAGAGEIDGNLVRLNVKQRVTSAAGDEPLFVGAVDISGSVDHPADELHAALVARWDGLGIAAAADTPVSSPAGELRVNGSFDKWSARLQTRLRAGGWPELEATGIFDGSERVVQVGELRLSGAPGTFIGRGSADFTAAPRVRLHVDASAVNAATLRSDLRGRLAAGLTLDVTWPDRVHVELHRLRGTFMERAVEASGTLQWTAAVTAIHDLRLRAGRNELRAAGEIGDRLAGRFAIQAPELAVLWPGLGGRLDGRGTIAGTRQRPEVRVSAAAEALQFESARVHSLSLDASIDRAGRLAARLRADGIASDERPLGGLLIEASGDLADHEIEVRLADGPVAIGLQSRGAWDGRSLRHRFGPAAVAVAPLGQWRLRDSAPWEFRNGAVTVGDHCWAQGEATLCLRQAMWSNARSVVAAELRDFSVAPLGELLGADMAISGIVEADLGFEQDAAGVTGSLWWRQDGTTFYYTGGDEPIVLAFPTARLELQATRELASFRAELRGQTGIGLQASGTLVKPFDDGGELAGAVSAEMPDIAEIVSVLAADWDLADVAGAVSLDARVAGTVAAPRVRGEVRLRDGVFALPDTGVRIEEIQLTARGDDAAKLRISGTARSGGVLRIDGEIEPFGTRGPSGLMRVHGRGIDVLRVPDRYVQASPRVTLRYGGGGLDVEGTVDVPKADIVVRQLPSSAVSPSADAVVHDRPVTAQAASFPRIGGALQINLGQDVRLTAFGLDTRLTGSLRLAQTPEGAAAGEGVVRLADGKFGAYGRELTIERGALIFTGPLDDPAFDLRASRRIDYEGRTVTAGLLLSGTAKRPESRVFSEPSMSEADALSYLIAGKPLSSAGAVDQSAIGGAALALGLRQASPITEQIGASVALDEFGVEGSEIDETQLVAGKQINPDLYLRFAYGLFNRIGTVLARYRIGRNFSVEAASGEDQSLDLVWSVERD